ncbi:MAG: hypothetical protein ACI9I0_001096, partial [Rhodoferax sp.]
MVEGAKIAYQHRVADGLMSGCVNRLVTADNGDRQFDKGAWQHTQVQRIAIVLGAGLQQVHGHILHKASFLRKHNVTSDFTLRLR